ncbi:violaceus kinesin [Talaromyces proteolyticus]|uniref:Violaceus kinesin n=1 Tax=Talaromyces proteolyticus TaxID=1131652 RepID=A0AAD4KDL8_9EURO|nr:violaceus kinesin [Talaromyces proteolyticus]KAH8689661.1 violaceus kinesin [Talaromyces proteolyticus]
MASPKRSHKDYSVAWVCALPLEMATAKAMLDETHSPLPQPPTDHNTYTLGSLNGHAMVMACLPYGVYGTTAAATVLAEMRATFPCLQFGLMVGIGGGVPSKHADIRLGDVVVSKPSDIFGGVIQYDYGKTIHGGRIVRTGSLNKPHPILLTAIAQVESNRILGKKTITSIVHDVLNTDKEIQNRFRQPENDWLFLATYCHEGSDSECEACDRNQLILRAARAIDGPDIHYGLIASGNQVMKDGQTRDRIAAMEGILCFEMEAAGLMDQLPCLVIRGICDYCDSHKNKQWQGYAALTAAAYARNLLSVIPINASNGDVEARKRLWMVPFPRNPRFVGRHDEITRLQNLISMSSGPMKIALTGLGGAGKTQIALELAYRMRHRDHQCSVFWISSVSPESVEQAYIRIAQHLRLRDVGQADVKVRVKSYLSHETAGRWLLICDNADDMEMWVSRNRITPSLNEYLPQSDHGCLLFTTRNRKLAQRLAPSHIISLPEIDEPTAKELLKKSLFRSDLLNEPTITTTLLQQLTFLPLAITQAAAYINANDIGIADYVGILQEQEHDIIELLSEDFEDEGRYVETQNPVATTWLVSFNQIQRLNSLAAEYLSFMACIDPRNIPLSLLPQAASQKKKIDALGLLKAYNFTTMHKDGLLSLHQLVHLATRNWMRQNNLLYPSACKTADRFKEVFPDNNHKNRSLWREYLPHALFLIGKHSFNDDKSCYVHLLERIGGCLDSDGRYNEAEIFFRDALHVQQKRYDRNHPNTLSSIGNLASIYQKQGRWNEAEELEVQVLKTCKTVLGIEHPDTLSSMGNLATIYYQQGRWEEAEELQMQALERKKTVLGTEHPNTLSSMGNLASIYRKQGRWKEAEELGMQVLKTRKIALGIEHPDTLSSMSNLASIYRKQGRWKEAEKLEVQVLMTCETVLGIEHPDTLSSMGNLASIYYRQGQWKVAEELYMQELETSKTVLGIDHPNTLTSMGNLATIYYQQGRWEEAEELQMQALETKKTVLGTEHPDTLSSISNLASIYRMQGQWKAAEELYMQVLEMRKTVLGTEHPKTLNSMANLALTWKDLGKRQDAAALMKSCVQLRMKRLGPNHPDTISSKIILSKWQAVDTTLSNSSSEIVSRLESQSPLISIQTEARSPSQSNNPVASSNPLLRSILIRRRKGGIFTRILGKM